MARGACDNPPPVTPGIAADIRQPMAAGYAPGDEAAMGSPGSASGNQEPSSPCSDLPMMSGIQFEKHSKGGFEAWLRDNATKRGKRYVCYIGKKRLSQGPAAVALYIETRLRQ